MSYSVKVLDHYENPRNVGSFAKDEEGVATGMVGAPACGDVMKLQIKVGKGGVIEDAKFKTYGCGSVSYTHLDVYKRQVLRWQGQAPGDGQNRAQGHPRYLPGTRAPGF